jgi:hypothetical protein
MCWPSLLKIRADPQKVVLKTKVQPLWRLLKFSASNDDAENFKSLNGYLKTKTPL